MRNLGDYQLRISLGALRHLGIGLYSNIPAVVAELVANAWDADARRVDIRIDGDSVTVTDDGIGMRLQDVNKRFLTVGYDKRSDEEDESTVEIGGAMVTAGRKRAVMGRKGIGKLSVFSVAERVEVYTRRKGAEPEAFLMSRKAIQDKFEGGSGETVYEPPPLPTDGIDFAHGTVIVLKKLDKRTSWAAKPLRQRLSRRFIVIGPEHDFEVRVNGKPIVVEDRGFYNDLQFLWYFDDDTESELYRFGNLHSHERYPHADRDDVVVPTPNGDIRVPFRVRGWIGTTAKPYDIDQTNGAIAVFARGRIVSEDIARDFKETGVFRQYVVGEIYADFLDLDGADDLVTSDRQRLVEEDPRYDALRAFLKDVLNHIQNRWTSLRREVGAQRAFDESPVLSAWYDRLSKRHQKYARGLIGKIEALPIPDENAKTEIYRASLIAFEKLALTEHLERLDVVESEGDFEVLRELFEGVDEYEATQYFQIVDNRLSVIETLKKALATDRAEEVIREHLPDHLWLLDPAWERAATNDFAERIAHSVFAEMEDTARFAASSTEGIRYRYAGGHHVIIDFRPYDERVSVGELVDQVAEFSTAFELALRAHGSERPEPLEYVCMMGWPVESEKLRKSLESVGARPVTYEGVIEDAERAYRAYIERQHDAARVVALIDTLARGLASGTTARLALAEAPAA